MRKLAELPLSYCFRLCQPHPMLPLTPLQGIYWRSAEGTLSTLAQFYALPVLSTRAALFRLMQQQNVRGVCVWAGAE